MSTAAPPEPLVEGSIGRALTKAAEWLAATGGLALTGAMLVTLGSVLGARFDQPLLGDNELVELLVGIAIACFMPYCHQRGANVIVDFFTMKLPPRLRDALDAAMNIVFALIIVVLTWRLLEGTYDQWARQRVSMFLQIPQWWGFAAASLACVLWALTSLRVAIDHLRRIRTPA